MKSKRRGRACHCGFVLVQRHVPLEAAIQLRQLAAALVALRHGLWRCRADLAAALKFEAALQPRLPHGVRPKWPAVADRQLFTSSDVAAGVYGLQ